MVDPVSGRLTDIIDWAAICPFGQNLHWLQDFSDILHQENGW